MTLQTAQVLALAFSMVMLLGMLLSLIVVSKERSSWQVEAQAQRLRADQYQWQNDVLRALLARRNMPTPGFASMQIVEVP